MKYRISRISMVYLIVFNVLSAVFLYVDSKINLRHETEIHLTEYLKYQTRHTERMTHYLNRELHEIAAMIPYTLPNQEFNNKIKNIKKSRVPFEEIAVFNSNGYQVSGETLISQHLPASKLKEIINSKRLQIQLDGSKKYSELWLYLPILVNKEKPYILVTKVDRGFFENLSDSADNGITFKLSTTPLYSTHKSYPNLSEDYIYASKKQKNFPLILNVSIKSASNREIFLNMYMKYIMIFITSLIFYFAYLVYKQQKYYDFIESYTDNQKQELVSQLAASTAHEIRNPLTGIKGLVTLLSEKYKTDPADKMYFSVIHEEIERINLIVSEFLVLGKPTTVDKGKHNLSDILDELTPMIQSEANLRGIDFIRGVPHDVMLVDCTKNHIKQLILNLCKNAVDSMDKNGILKIILESENNHAKLIISDTGCGISKEMMNSIFEPFYTTKETGTGLGLLVCKRIVEMYHGQIKIDSTVNKGTTIQIFFPLV